MEIRLGATICKACGDPATVGFGAAPLCIGCFELELRVHHDRIERMLLEWDLDTERRLEMIRSPLLCGDGEP